jgi:cobyrinic acid a,c-diamide synthase
MDGLGKAVGSGLGGVGSSIGGLYDSFGRAVSGLVSGATTAALSNGPLILVVGAAIVLVAALLLVRSLR